MAAMKKQFKLLVADDSAAVRESVSKMLTGHVDPTYHVINAVNGLEACNLAFQERPDLVLLDIEMPVMNGIDAIAKIKRTSQIKSIPIIVMSSTRQFQKAFEAGANDFLIKPFNEYELMMRVMLNLNLAEKNSEIKHQNELLKNQRQEAINQRDTISFQKNMLLEELNYASYIQRAVLPSQTVLSQLFNSFFIYNRPKNIVSGDFYWTIKKNNQIIIVVGDCTGHGMSGALMTMAGVTFLNEITSGTFELSADRLLNDLRNKVIHLLNQKGEIGEASNGMDLALCIYNEQENSLQFSGANNPIYFVRSAPYLEFIKGDRMPIGFYFNELKPFSKHEIQISKGDKIYLFSDGYPDQFGGPLGQKFRYNQFRDLISRASLLPTMDEELELITYTMDNWIKGNEQVDDMLILGIQF
jgi:phosphoserine phosphatase RsbU/P